MAQQIERVYVRRYSDSGQVTAYVEWSDGSRTEGTAQSRDIEREEIKLGRRTFHVGVHMAQLLRRATRDGIVIEYETW